jgi:hypothetical protein
VNKQWLAVACSNRPNLSFYQRCSSSRSMQQVEQLQPLGSAQVSSVGEYYYWVHTRCRAGMCHVGCGVCWHMLVIVRRMLCSYVVANHGVFPILQAVVRSHLGGLRIPAWW